MGSRVGCYFICSNYGNSHYSDESWSLKESEGMRYVDNMGKEGSRLREEQVQKAGMCLVFKEQLNQCDWNRARKEKDVLISPYSFKSLPVAFLRFNIFFLFQTS